MHSLEVFKPTIEKVITSISHIFDVDAAVIDKQGKLVVSTQGYLKHKGQSVHVPSIEEVLTNGRYLVDKPGYMDSCSGCRFNTHCPAKMEVMNCINLENRAIGVVSLTSFTIEGQNRLSKRLDKYQQILQEVTEIIVTIVKQESQALPIDPYYKMLEETLDFSTDAFISIDNNGSVVHCNTRARSLFTQHNLPINDVSQIIPSSHMNKIIAGHNMSDLYIEKLQSFVSSASITMNNGGMGAVLRLNTKPAPALKKSPVLPPVRLPSLESIKGTSQKIVELKNKIERIKNSSSTVLITGETGTGKGHLAKTIHETSNRAPYPFVSVNCASIPESLFESELFGYEEGAFTGAKKGGKLGKFECAEGGTLFLDEIGDLPLQMQPKLLQVLQESTIERVGGTRSTPINVRIIAATNHNLEELVAQKKFRADLYYRLQVIPLTVPPLRERKSDIELLSLSFLQKGRMKAGRNILGFSPEAIAVLQTYSWPGNIRELENTVEYAINMETTDEISVNSLPDRLLNYGCRIEQAVPAKLIDIQVETIRAALNKHGYDVKGKTEAAKELGIGIRTLYRKLKMYHI